MDHAILTRFNFPSQGVEGFVRARPNWLKERMQLFHRYCLPSVLAQTCRDFRWLIYFDTESPAWLRQRVEDDAAAGHYVPVFRREVRQKELLSDIASVFPTMSGELLTSNLDNDDALASDFVERLHGQRRIGRATAYVFGNGLVKNGASVYQRYDRLNAFPSVLSGWDDPVTAWADWHTHLDDYMPVIDLGGSPAWLQVVHGGNVSNKTRGVLASPIQYRQRFDGLLDDVLVPDRAALLIDHLVLAPFRSTRDMARTAGKRIVVGLSGREGLDRTKIALIRASARWADIRPKPRS